MSWVKDLVDLVRTVATLTKDVERTTAEIKELRRDVNELSKGLKELMIQLKNEKEKTEIILNSYNREITHMGEGMAAKFAVLTTVLDQKIDGFESRIEGERPKLKPNRRKRIPATTSKKSET